MLRFLFVLLAALFFVAAAPQFAMAQSWPDSGGEFSRGPGGYLSVIKILLSWFLFLAWVKTTDWVSQDCLKHRLNYGLWNTVIFFTFVASFILLWLLPWFELGIGLMAVAYAAPLGAYIAHRNSKVDSTQRVLTPDHLRLLFANVAGVFGIKIEAERKPDHERGPPVKLTPHGAESEMVNQANAVRARQLPGYLFVRELLYDAVEHSASGIMLDYSQSAVGVRYQIDGVWHQHEPRDRDSGDSLLAVMKTLSALNPEDRVTKQQGWFGAEYNGSAYECRLNTQGVETGERVVLQLYRKKAPVMTFDEIGMRPKMQEQLKEALARQDGMILLSSLPAGGLSTTFDAVLKTADRYMRDFASVEDATKREREIENLHVTTYNAAAGESPATVLPEIIRKYPNVIVVRELANNETASILCEQAKDDRLVITGIRAKESVEALLRVLMLKVPAQEFAPVVRVVLNQRLVRKLCENCKEAYAPPPEVFKQLGIPAGRVEVLYREPTQTEGKVCPACRGLGYRGRTAFFELLVVDDSVRQAMVRTPKLDVLRTAARKAGMRTLQEEGIVLVVKGITSITELTRVLKQ